MTNPAPPGALLNNSRRAQIRKILAEYGQTQVPSSIATISVSENGAEKGHAAGRLDHFGNSSDKEGERGQAEAYDAMDKLRQLIPDRMQISYLVSYNLAIADDPMTFIRRRTRLNNPSSIIT